MDRPASGEKGFKGRIQLACIRGKGVSVWLGRSYSHIPKLTRWICGTNLSTLEVFSPAPPPSGLRRTVCLERELVIDNLLVRIHFIIVIIRWTGLAPW